MNKSFLLIPLVVLIFGLGYISTQTKSPAAPVILTPSAQTADQHTTTSSISPSSISLATISTHSTEGDC